MIALLVFLLLPYGSQLTISWEPVTTNEDGTAWTDRGGYRLYEKRDSGPWVTRAGIHPDYTRIRYTPYFAGTYKFRVTAITRYARPRLESKPSNEVEVVIDPMPTPRPSPSPTSTGG